jgi:murein DD-endopeptidase MepM/ murein hydrolase activator NlpD
LCPHTSIGADLVTTRSARRAAGRLGAFGALGAVLIGACAPATQCAPVTPVAPLAPAPPTPTPPPADIPLEARPVQAPCTFTDTWGAARAAGRIHEGTDIMAAEGNQVYAVVSGVISKVYSADRDALAGNGIQISTPDGTFFFYAHMAALAPGIAVGTAVTAGQLVGTVGHTGNAGVPHLHLEIHPGGGAAINPYAIVVKHGAC